MQNSNKIIIQNHFVIPNFSYVKTKIYILLKVKSSKTAVTIVM